VVSAGGGSSVSNGPTVVQVVGECSGLVGEKTTFVVRVCEKAGVVHMLHFVVGELVGKKETQKATQKETVSGEGPFR
jgi:hypothetical protein